MRMRIFALAYASALTCAFFLFQLLSSVLCLALGDVEGARVLVNFFVGRANWFFLFGTRLEEVFGDELIATS